MTFSNSDTMEGSATRTGLSTSMVTSSAGFEKRDGQPVRETELWQELSTSAAGERFLPNNSPSFSAPMPNAPPGCKK